MQATFEDGEVCTLTKFDGKFLSMKCVRAFAPGQPVAISVDVGGTRQRIAGRSLGSRRNAAGGFDLQVRPVNLPRGTRLALSAAFSDQPANA